MNKRIASLTAVSMMVAVWASLALARPIPVGQFTRIPYGISGKHPWSTTGGGRLRQSRSNFLAPQHAPSRVWSIELEGGRIFAPAIDKDDHVFVSTHRGLAGVTTKTDPSAATWKKRFGLLTGTASLTPAGHLAVALRSRGAVVIVDRNGTDVRQISVGGNLVNNPLVLDDGSIVVARSDKSVARFDSMGRLVFSTFLDEQIRSELAMHSGGLVIATDSQVVFMGIDGTIQNRVAINRLVLGPAIADDGTVWVATYNELTSLTKNGVGTSTSLPFTVSHSSKLAIGRDNAVRVGGSRGGIACVGPGGTVKWVYTAASFAGGLLVDKRNTTLAISRMRRLTAIDASGKMLWETEVNGYTDTTPVLSKDGTVLLTMERPTELQAWR